MITDNFLDTEYARAILFGLQRKHVYMGTADSAKVAKRRAKNKVASKQRQTNRRNGSGR